MDLSKYPQAKIFETHGVDFSGIRGDELYGTCPFTGKDDKFYVNRKTWLWDSKTAGLSGNIPKFLEEIQGDYADAIDDAQWANLSRHRGLPEEAFKAWNIGWTGDRYTIPVRDPNGRVQDIRLYQLSKKQMRSTTGCAVGLLGAHFLPKDLSSPIYLCEGEWDAMAFAWLLKQLREPGITLAVPGAGTFKREWIPWLTGRKVTVLYDNDDPGRKGATLAQERLQTSAKQMAFVHWPDNLPEGFDIRDWIKYGIKKNTLKLCLERLRFLWKKSAPRGGDGSLVAKNGKIIRLIAPAKGADRLPRPDTVPTLADVHAVYNKWLHLSNTDAIDIMLAVTLSQKMDGPPVWLFLVGPPGGAKTVTLSGLIEYEHSYNTSSLTAHSLISGANFQGQTDPSLVPRLNGKVLVIKDFTSILGMRDNDKEEIFSILRDAYDGRCGKVFGNGVERSYESRFTIVAAVTPEIYLLGHRHSALGERFLKFTMGDNLHHENEEDIISRAIENVDRDSRIREELAKTTGLFLSYGFEELKVAGLDNVIHQRIIALAQLGARLRGVVNREYYTNDMTGRPFAEVGSRLGIQLSKIARALAMIRGKVSVSDAEYQLVKKIMIDTVSQRNEDIVRCIYQHYQKTKNMYISSSQIAEITQYPPSTIKRILDDLVLLRIVAKKGMPGMGFKHVWSLSPYILRCITQSQVYTGATPRRILLKQK